jgi:hypothetical protein
MRCGEYKKPSPGMYGGGKRRLARLSAFTNKPYGIYTIAIFRNDNASGTKFLSKA